MSDEDNELEILKAKRLAEMQKNISIQEKQKEFEQNLDVVEKERFTPREYVVKSLGHRGMEVLQNAESQLVLFRSVVVNIRMQNKINVEQDGKFVSIADKFKHKSHTDDDK